jgi:hypothetical protein
MSNSSHNARAKEPDSDGKRVIFCGHLAYFVDLRESCQIKTTKNHDSLDEHCSGT